jgi:DNA-binding IclR family transcriptional regulator
MSSMVFDREADYQVWAELREAELREIAWAARAPSFSEVAAVSLKALNEAQKGEEEG